MAGEAAEPTPCSTRKNPRKGVDNYKGSVLNLSQVKDILIQIIFLK
jgi:hypothetical protein